MNNLIAEEMKSDSGNMNEKGKAKKRGHKARYVLLFCVVAALITFAVTDVLRQKWNYSEAVAQQALQGYYKEKDHTLDVICLGASSIRNGVSGLEMYHDYGFTTYSRATSVQHPAISYNLLLETLETQDIKAVVMDATPLSNNMFNGYSKQEYLGKIHESIDYMPWSSYKLNIIQEIQSTGVETSLTEFAVPLYTYHDRWESINKDDFTYREWQGDYYYKGQFPALRRYVYSFDSDFMTDESEDESFVVDDVNAGYYEKIIQLCEDKGIRFVLVKMPTGSWTLDAHNKVNAFAEEHDIAFLDFNQQSMIEATGFNSKEDFRDVTFHLNITGAKKISEYLGEYLCGVCDFTDKRNDPEYESWNADYEKYASLLRDDSLYNEKNFVAYLQKLKNPDYITMIATRDDTSKFYNEYEASAFADLGIDVPFGDTSRLSYLAIIDDGSAIYQDVSEESDGDNRLSHFEVVDGHKIQMTSCASQRTNQASISFDGEELSLNTSGFNIVVYDKNVNQIISQRAFNTGLRGTTYDMPNPFSDYTADPLGYLDLLDNDDYITVVAVCGEGSRYMPGVVNDKLAEMGLIPLDGEFDRAYLAVLDGSRVVYNQYGERGTALEAACEIDGIPVTAVSSTRSDSAHAYFLVGEDEPFTQRSAGLTFYVYSKSEQRRITVNRFDWSNNYTAQARVDGKASLVELLEAANRGGYDVLSLYAKGRKSSVPSANVLETMREYGFTLLDGEDSYLGVVRADGQAIQQGPGDAVSLEAELDGVPVTLLAENGQGEATFDGISYAARESGLHVFVYDAANRAVLTQARYDRNSDLDASPFVDFGSDPLGYLDLLNNDDYITVMAVGGEGSRYMPGVVNDKLAQMGLIPLDGEFNRPYIAVLNGGEIVYNRYGEPDTEIDALCEVEGVPISVVSGAKSGNGHTYIAVDGENPWTGVNTGLYVCVYSKSENRMLTYNRFDWSANYTAESRVDGKTNLMELLEAVNRGGYDVLCLYAPGTGEEAPAEEAFDLLRRYGFEKLTAGTAYAGIVRPDGQTTQSSLQTPAELRYELDGTPVTLYAEEGQGEATFDGVAYAANRPGLYVFVYDAPNRAVLTQLKLENAVEETETTAFSDYKDDILGYLDLLNNDDYITAFAVSAEGSRYMPGVVNDKLAEMGLIPLDKELNRPYVAVLNGGQVVYNAYGEPGTELVAECEVEGTPVLVISSTASGSQRAYLSIGSAEYTRSKKHTGLTLLVYSKSRQQEVVKRRINWGSAVLSPTSLEGITNPLELLSTARHAGYDVLCAASGVESVETIDPELLSALREIGLTQMTDEEVAQATGGMDASMMNALSKYGFTRLGETACYVGVVRADGEVEQYCDAESAAAEIQLEGTVATLSAGAKRCSATFFEGAEYASKEQGIHLYFYDPVSKAVVNEITYANGAIEEGDSEDVSED